MLAFLAVCAEGTAGGIVGACVVVSEVGTGEASAAASPEVQSVRSIKTSTLITPAPISRWVEGFVWMVEGIKAGHPHTVVVSHTEPISP